jgi:hypothetical protein
MGIGLCGGPYANPYALRMCVAGAATPLWRAMQLVAERFLATRQVDGTLEAPYQCAG